MSSLLLIVLLILVLQSIVSVGEAAIFSVPINRVRQLAENSNAAKTLLSLKESMSRPIATLIALSSLITILGSVIVGLMTSKIFGEIWIGLVGIILTFLVMIFAEIIPKRLGEKFAEPAALLLARPIKVIAGVFKPIIWFIEKITGPVTTRKNTSISKEEIVFLAHLGEKEGSIAPYEGQLIEGVFKLGNVTAGDMMTPKPFVFFLDGSKTLKETLPFLQKENHSRIPVYEGSKERIVGIVHQRDMLRALSEGKENTLVSAYMRRPLVVPDSRLGDDLLKDFLSAKSHLAIVIDDYGAVAGVVGLEDVLEEVVGEIIDEKDVRPELIKRMTRNVIIVHGQTHVPDINRFFNTTIASKKTLNGFLLRRFGHLPAAGESLKLDKLVFAVEEVSPSSIERVRITKEE